MENPVVLVSVLELVELVKVIDVVEMAEIVLEQEAVELV